MDVWSIIQAAQLSPCSIRGILIFLNLISSISFLVQDVLYTLILFCYSFIYSFLLFRSRPRFSHLLSLDVHYSSVCLFFFLSHSGRAHSALFFFFSLSFFLRGIFPFPLSAAIVFHSQFCHVHPDPSTRSVFFFLTLVISWNLS